MKKLAIFLTALTMFSKMLGFIRDITLSYFYGTSNVSDAYLISQTIPNFILSFISTGITAGFIPLYNEINSKDGILKANRFTSNFINILLFISTILLLLGVFFAESLVKFFANGFSGETLNLSITLTRISLFSIYFYIAVSVFHPFLQINGNYIIPASIGFPLNLVNILFIFLSSKGNILLLGIGVIISNLSQLLFVYPFVRKKGYTHNFFIDFRDENIKNLLLISLPIIIGTSIDQINILVDRNIASSIASGGISALTYANRLNLIIIGLFVMPIISIIYPIISKLISNNDMEKFVHIVFKSINICTIIVIPISLFFMSYSKDIIEILFVRGNFDLNSVRMTSGALFFYAIGIIGFSYRDILSRAFYSMKDTKTPTINAIIAMILNIILNIILSKFFGINGLALATSISSIFSAFLLFINFILKTDIKFMKNLFLLLIKVTTSSLIMVFLSKNIYYHLNINKIVLLSISFIIGFIVYLLILFLMGVDEIKENLIIKPVNTIN